MEQLRGLANLVKPAAPAPAPQAAPAPAPEVKLEAPKDTVSFGKK